MEMYRKQPHSKKYIQINKNYEGETIEKKIQRITANSEPISDGAPLIYTDKAHGVGAEYNIRTDRFEIAVDAMDKVYKATMARREGKAEAPIVKMEKKDGGAETTEATNV